MDKETRREESATASPDVDVVIIGAGVGGLYAIHNFRKLGLKVQALEAGSDIGGTWFWNRYPGCRCDVESTEYSYSFSPELDQEWNWTERFASQPEILRYINHVADRFQLRPFIRLNQRVTSAIYDGTTNIWTVSTENGDAITCTWLVTATGPLSLPQVPKIDGLDTFKGETYFTALWPHEDVDFTGKRVGVIGTGSSGIQSIPIFAQQAERLYVFQRTAQYSVPAGNEPLSPEYIKSVKANYPEARVRARYSKSGNSLYKIPDKSVFDDSPEERKATYDALWKRGGLNFLRAYKDLLLTPEANETAAQYVRERIREKILDPKLADQLIPTDHHFGTKRPVSDTNYFETYNRGNVTLVDLKKTPITAIIEKGLQTTDGLIELDALIFATGFDAVTGALLNIDIRVKDGLTLREKWAQGPKALLGVMSAGLPNLFMLTGAGSPSVFANVILVNEQQVEWIGDLIMHLRANGFTRIEPTLEAERDWAKHVHDVAQQTLLPTANSWHIGANIPGKPRVFLTYVSGLDVYRRTCDKIAAEGYPGFVMTTPHVTGSNQNTRVPAASSTA